MLSLTYSRRALKDLRTLPGVDRLRILDRLEAYAAEPEAPGHDVLPLAGQPGDYRLRFGDWRALFTLTEAEMTVYRIRHRREAYR